MTARHHFPESLMSSNVNKQHVLLFDNVEKNMPKVVMLKSIASLLPKKEAESHGIINSSEHVAAEINKGSKLAGYLKAPMRPKSTVVSMISNLNSARFN